jgi:hypothetical protein
MASVKPQAFSGRILIYPQREGPLNLPDAPIAHEGFFATHFFTVKDQEKSKTSMSEFLAG